MADADQVKRKYNEEKKEEEQQQDITCHDDDIAQQQYQQHLQQLQQLGKRIILLFIFIFTSKRLRCVIILNLREQCSILIRNNNIYNNTFKTSYYNYVRTIVSFTLYLSKTPRRTRRCFGIHAIRRFNVMDVVWTSK